MTLKTEPITHLPCGALCVARWVIDDAGGDAIVAWCDTCDTAPEPHELNRSLLVSDVPPGLLINVLSSAQRKH